MGGDNSEHNVTYEASMESYNQKFNTWTTGPPMNMGRYGAVAAVLIIDGHAHVYVCGGKNSATGKLRSVERFNMSSRANWTEVAPMNSVRFGAAAAVHNDLL
jgi:hypothetical protein